MAWEANAIVRPSGDTLGELFVARPWWSAARRRSVRVSASHRCVPGVGPSERVTTMWRLSGSQLKTGGHAGPGRQRRAARARGSPSGMGISQKPRARWPVAQPRHQLRCRPARTAVAAGERPIVERTARRTAAARRRAATTDHRRHVWLSAVACRRKHGRSAVGRDRRSRRALDHHVGRAAGRTDAPQGIRVARAASG